jgi:hypothetical protein
VGIWDADFYVKVDDDVHVNLGAFYFFDVVAFFWRKNQLSSNYHLIGVLHMEKTGMLATTLARHKSKPRTYIGCMKSGPVLADK